MCLLLFSTVPYLSIITGLTYYVVLYLTTKLPYIQCLLLSGHRQVQPQAFRPGARREGPKKGLPSLWSWRKRINNSTIIITIIQNKDHKNGHRESYKYKILLIYLSPSPPFSFAIYTVQYCSYVSIPFGQSPAPRPHSLERSRGTSIQYRMATQSLRGQGGDHPASPRPARRRGSGTGAAEARSRADNTVVTHPGTLAA